MKRNLDNELQQCKAEVERLKAQLKHETEGTIYCPGCGERGIAGEVETVCPKCDFHWMTASQQERWWGTQLTAEREITLGFRNTLEKVISQDRLRGYPTGNEWMALCDLIKAVLAREKEMRK